MITLLPPLVTAPQARKEVLAGTRILVQFLRGRNLILSSGAESHTDVRGVFDVLNIGQLLNLTQEQVREYFDTCIDIVNMHVYSSLLMLEISLHKHVHRRSKPSARTVSR